ncbi:FAD-dependent oxidoreductase [Aquibium sp. ELW1220]|uniref:FAD-dependent oxidoreductase n=1 Tax=Aquibium sp. ELW1220 TaxID=2976766 RepID=UPI0025B042C4|nr:FAD-dependent oxidoreductase [Aquibium sp. ELW1220]MDN2582065.1 FAD-dependent oxidoreductase [Aquibium sp. ELW1220]
MSRRVAIVGAGPSGCFVAQALLKARPELQVDVLDRLPVPYGLVRYGVAADHQGTKAITRQFSRLFERQGARFFGNVAIGRDLTLEALREAYDAVVIATGLAADRRLGVPGDDLAGVYGAGRITRALYEHPDAEPLPPLGPRPLIVGNGNVAIDLLRLLAKTPGELDGSDLGPGPTAWLAGSGIEEITILGRSPASAARFDAVMLKELVRLGGVSISVEDLGTAETEEGTRTLEALAALRGHGTGARRIRFVFARRPLAVEGAGHVTGLLCAAPDGGEERFAATSILTAIGFDGETATAQSGSAVRMAPGLYGAGWFARGPRGTIPDNRADAQALASLILADLDAMPATGQRGELLACLPGVVTYDGWTRIDAAETATPPPGRCRAKIADRAAMLSLAAGGDQKESH